jgi:hypothetical protein
MIGCVTNNGSNRQEDKLNLSPIDNSNYTMESIYYWNFDEPIEFYKNIDGVNQAEKIEMIRRAEENGNLFITLVNGKELGKNILNNNRDKKLYRFNGSTSGPVKLLFGLHLLDNFKVGDSWESTLYGPQNIVKYYVESIEEKDSYETIKIRSETDMGTTYYWISPGEGIIRIEYNDIRNSITTFSRKSLTSDETSAIKMRSEAPISKKQDLTIEEKSNRDESVSPIKVSSDFIVIPDWKPEDGLSVAPQPEAIGFLTAQTEISEIENLAGKAPDQEQIITGVLDSHNNYLLGSQTFSWWKSSYFTNIHVNYQKNELVRLYYGIKSTGKGISYLPDSNQFNPIFENGLGLGSTFDEFLDSGLLKESDFVQIIGWADDREYNTPYYTLYFREKIAIEKEGNLHVLPGFCLTGMEIQFSK